MMWIILRTKDVPMYTGEADLLKYDKEHVLCHCMWFVYKCLICYPFCFINVLCILRDSSLGSREGSGREASWVFVTRANDPEPWN